MKIEWNRVTWYSVVLAVLLFLATFAIAFGLGIRWERAQIESSLAASAGSDGATTTPGIAGARCGGFIKDAPTCAAGFHCQLAVSRPDTGGICVPDQTDIRTPSWTKGMSIVTQQSNGATVSLKKNERFAIELGDELDWTLSFTPTDAITRVANSINTDGFQGVYAAAKTGTATLTAVGKPRCAAGMMCAQYLVEMSVIFNISE